MTNETCRSADFWKDAIMKMPDNSFFELLRCVFGKIKTPFNKQQLLNDLEKFLLREDVQKSISSYIDSTDAKIIAAITLFGEPVPQQLENFFAGEYSYAQLQDLLVNLEERFILYRFTEEKPRSVSQYSAAETKRIALNPVLKPVLIPFSACTAELFPEAVVKNYKRGENSIVINDLILASLYSFICRRGMTFYRPEGVIRKRIIDEGRNLFPQLDLEDILGVLQILGLFYAEENILVPDNKYFNDFSLISARERMEYFAAAMMVYSELTAPFDFLPPLFRSRIREIVNFISVFLDSLKPEAMYHEQTLIRIAEILKSKTGITVNTEMLFETLEKTGLIIKNTNDVIQAGELAQNKTKTNKAPVIVIETGSSILMYPEINFSDAISLASVLNICETGAVPGSSVARFELDRDSAVRAFDSNIKADDIIELLTRLSGRKKDETLIWNLKNWEQRYSEVSLQSGVILKLSENQRYLTETYPLSDLIIETPAPGIYLLNDGAAEDAADALQKAGIDIIARRLPQKEKKALSSGNYFPSLRSEHADFTMQPVSFYSDNASQHGNKKKETQGGYAAFNGDNSCELKNKYLSVLEKMKIGSTEKAELTARIDRRLILCEEQLKDAEIRYEKLEARLLDYAGKQNIAKHAIAAASSVEVVWSFKGKEERIFGIPRALEKKGNDLILVINTAAPLNIQDKQETVSIPLAKISLIRKIKKSIFEK